jgi:lysophospholipase L1-like esterase
VHVSVGGAAVRVMISNEFGVEPLVIGGAEIAQRPGGKAAGAAIDAASEKALTFGGEKGVVVPPGAYVTSDRLEFRLGALSDVAVDLYLPAQTMHQLTLHGESLQTNYRAMGNQAGAAGLTDAKEYARWYFLKGLDVEERGGGSIVAFGDSITDGHKGSVDGNMRWPDVLAGRLQKDARTKGLGVLNMGISGNRLMRDLGGVSALARFDRDVLGQAGVKYLIILEGINDIGHVDRPAFPLDKVTGENLTFVLGQMIERAHAHGIKVYGATLTPYPGGVASAEAIVRLQGEENAWIRTSGKFDGVIDFDKVTLDPANPTGFLPAYDSGDHLHPGDAGYDAMGKAVDLGLFTR